MTDIRAFEPGDLDACYAISLATGFEGGDASHLYRDPKIMGHIYVAPYVLLEPSHAFVVEDGDGVAGFAVGTMDTVAWEERLEREWWPTLRGRYADPVDIPADRRTPDQRRAHMLHHPAKTPAAVTATYPAHLHMNLLPRTQRRGVGSRLMHAWLQRAAGNVHVGVNRANTRAVGFWAASGFQELVFPCHREGRTCWMGMTGGEFSASIQTK